MRCGYTIMNWDCPLRFGHHGPCAPEASLAPPSTRTMNVRPVIGARVRLLTEVGLPKSAGREGVVTHYITDDEVAFVVEFPTRRVRVLNPIDVELIAGPVRAVADAPRDTEDAQS